jgi:hypothetical protein
VRFLFWLGRSPFATALKVGVSVVLAMALADWTTTGSIGFDKWEAWVIAAAATALPIITNYLNPTDGRYGAVLARTETPDGDL